MENDQNKKYYKILQDAIDQNLIALPSELSKVFVPFRAYRAINMKAIRPLERSDFNSQAERASNILPVDKTDWGNYSCSCFTDISKLYLAMKLPRKGKRVAVGMICCEFGSVFASDSTSHIHWFLCQGKILTC